MSWTVEQRQMLEFWAGRVPARLVADFIGKRQANVNVYASKHGISLSFYGSHKKHGTKNKKKPARERDPLGKYDPYEEAEERLTLVYRKNKTLLNSIFR